MRRFWGKILKGALRLWAFTLVSVLVGVMIGLMTSAADNSGNNSGKPGTKQEPFRFAFSQNMFSDVNITDARSAMTMWISGIARENNVVVRVDPSTHLDWRSMEDFLKNNQLDGAGMTAEEIWNVMPHVKLDRFIVGLKDGKTTEEYVLLVNRGSGVRNLADLSGRSLLVLQNPRMGLAMVWLNTLLMTHGLPPADHFFDHLDFEGKPMRVVLPVFFQRTDACLVTRQVFDVMKELNPQIGESLEALSVSPALTPSAFCFRQSFVSPKLDQFLSDMKHLGDTPGGRQVLTLLQVDAVVERPASCLDSAFQLLTDYSRLKGHAMRGKK